MRCICCGTDTEENNLCNYCNKFTPNIDTTSIHNKWMSFLDKKDEKEGDDENNDIK